MNFCTAICQSKHAQERDTPLFHAAWKFRALPRNCGHGAIVTISKHVVVVTHDRWKFRALPRNFGHGAIVAIPGYAEERFHQGSAILGNMRVKHVVCGA